MGACCDTSTKKDFPARAICPANGQTYKRVARKTLLHHLVKPWQLELPDQGYYFCDSEDCNVVYFGEDQCVFTRDKVRTDVGQKSNQISRSVCYCFGVTQQDIDQSDEPRKFIVEQTRAGTCDCEIRNPAGRCCLKDILKGKA